MTAINAGGVDTWMGSSEIKMVVGVLCTVDLLKRDTELTILYDCMDDEIGAILNLMKGDQMGAIVIKRD